MQIYFDNAATSSPKPEAVIQEMTRAMREYNANPGRSGHESALKAAHCIYESRRTLADFLNAEDSSCLSFHLNCTDALNLGIKGVLSRGDHVISTMLEHNSVLRVLTGLSRSGMITLTLVNPRPDGFVDPADIQKNIRRNTRLIVMTHASNVTGAIQPVAAVGQIAQQHGVHFLIDGAQVLGAFPVSVADLHCSMYAFPGHKSLLGPQGTGGLYVKSGLRLNTLREGGTGTDSDNMLQPDDAPERYESGTLNTPGIAGLRRGVEFVSARMSQIIMHERELCSALQEGLARLPDAVLYSPGNEAARAGIVSFNIGDMNSGEVSDLLAQRGFAVRSGLHCAPGAHAWLGTLRRGVVRASVGYASTMQEVDAFLKAIFEIARHNA